MIRGETIRLLIIIIILLLTMTNWVYPQSLQNNFVHFTQKDGLQSNDIGALFQDHLGYIWVGTNNGVSRFDGYDFHNFSVVKDDSNFLQLPLTISLFEDSNGDIWIGSVSGITKYDRGNENFTLYHLGEFEANEERTFGVMGINETDGGDIIFGVFDFFFRDFDNGLYLIRNGSRNIEVINPDGEMKTNAIANIIRKDKTSFYLIGFNGFREYNFLENSVINYPLIGEKVVTAICHDANNLIWLGILNEGIYLYDITNNTLDKITIPNHLSTDNDFLVIQDIAINKNKDLLITTNRGLAQLNRKTHNISFVNFDIYNPSALHSNNLNDILVDRSGIIWISSKDAGLSKYNLAQNNFQSYTNNPNDETSIPPGWVNTIFEVSPNELWVKAQSDVISVFNKKNGSFGDLKYFKPNNIEAIIREDNILWVGGGQTLYKVDLKREKFEVVKLPFSLTQTAIHSLFIDSKNNFWIGTHFGLYSYDRINNQGAKIDFETLGIGNLASNAVFNIVEDKSSDIWFGTDNGLFKYSYDNMHYTRIGNSADSTKLLNSQDVNSLYIDSSGIIWAGTWLGGLNRIDPKTEIIKSYTLANGFNSHSVQSILGDEKNGDLWLSSFDGISRFDIENETFQNFDIKDGIQGFQFAHKAAFKTSEGEFLFGGQNGLTIFKPENLTKDILPPEVLITDFKIFNETVNPGESSVLNSPIYKTDEISLNHDENDISFEFLAIHYANPEENKYAYKLQNYEEEWRYVGNQRYATYPNLPSGKYVFRVKAANGNNVWNEEGKSLTVTIYPPPWSSWWAYSAYIIIFSGLLYSVRKFELRRQKKNAEIKESQLRAESAEMQAKAAEAQAQVMQVENDRKSKELEEARQLQLSMLPRELPQLPNIDIAVYMKTATEVGGDYYDFHIGLDGTLTVVLGDATGHGMKAGTMVTTTKSLFNVLAPNSNIIDTFHEMTRCLKLMHLEKLSMCMTMLKITGNKLQMSAAGMPPVFIYKKESQIIEEHVMKGMPLGTFNNFPYTLLKSELCKGDTILLMSDGFPELFNDKKEMYGYKRARNLFEDLAEQSPEAIISQLKNTGSEWTSNKDPDDDVTFVVIKVK